MTPLLKKQEVADLLKVSPRTIDAWCRARLLSFRRIPGGKRFTYEDLNAFLDSRLVSHRSIPSSPRITL